jgi:hypothetical protein
VLFLELRLSFENLFSGLRLLGDLCLVQTPLLLVFIVGLVRAANHSPRSPRVYLLVVLALVLMLVQTVLMTFWTASLAEPDPRRLRNNLVVVELVRSLANVGTWVLLLCAVFGPRGQATPSPRPGRVVDPESSPSSPLPRKKTFRPE